MFVYYWFVLNLSVLDSQTGGALFGGGDLEKHGIRNKKQSYQYKPFFSFPSVMFVIEDLELSYHYFSSPVSNRCPFYI